jgi:hypothetical protein
LLAVAIELFNQRRFELVVIVAQMVCEVLAAMAIDVFVARKGIALIGKWIDDRLPNANLGHPIVRSLYETVSGDVFSNQGFWAEYMAHVARRNDAVHEGKRGAEDEAAASLRVCEALVVHLNSVLP